MRIAQNSKPKQKISNKSGFSLLELMIAIGILIVLMTGLFYSYIKCMELNEFSRNMMLVNNALQAQLETIRETVAFDNLIGLNAQPAVSMDNFGPADKSVVVISLPVRKRNTTFRPTSRANLRNRSVDLEPDVIIEEITGEGQT